MILTVLKKTSVLLLAVLCLTACFVLPLSAADQDPVSDRSVSRVYDPAEMLNPAETADLNTLLDSLSKEHGVELYFATYLADGPRDDFYGDDYCTRVQNLKGTDAVLLVVTYERLNDTYYYNMYTYGAANYDISQKEVNYILDDYDVYTNLKYGYIHDGCVPCRPRPFRGVWVYPGASLS